jgi:hypothetical protein
LVVFAELTVVESTLVLSALVWVESACIFVLSVPLVLELEFVHDAKAIVANAKRSVTFFIVFVFFEVLKIFSGIIYSGTCD